MSSPPRKTPTQPGTALPSDIDIARGFGISTEALQNAFDRLEAERLAEQRQGMGTLVLDQGAQAVSRRPSVGTNSQKTGNSQHTIITQQVSGATASESRRLAIPESENVLRTCRLRTYLGRPIAYEQANVAISRFPGFQSIRDADEHLIAPMAKRYGLRLGRAIEKVTIAPVSSDVARLLDVALGAMLLKLDRLIFSVNGEPIEWRVALRSSHQRS